MPKSVKALCIKSIFANRYYKRAGYHERSMIYQPRAIIFQLRMMKQSQPSENTGLDLQQYGTLTTGQGSAIA